MKDSVLSETNKPHRKSSPSESLLWLAENLGSILSLLPALQEYETIKRAADVAKEAATQASVRVQELENDEESLHNSIKELQNAFNKKKLEYNDELKIERQRLSQELEDVRREHKSKLEAGVSEATKRKLNVERLIEERQARLKELSKQVNDLTVENHYAEQRLRDFESQIAAIKAKF